MSVRQRRAVAGLAPAALAIAAAAVGGCATSTDRTPYAVGQSSASDAVVLPSDETAAFYNERNVLLVERWEYSRSNDEVSARRAAPRVASQQWPQRPEPAERPIRFERWRQ